MCGTPAYLAPEVVCQANNEGYDQLVDSWSVGVIVFCMCVCLLPRASTSTHRSPRIAMCNPFEDDANVDVKTNVNNRRIQWHYLRDIQPPVSEECTCAPLPVPAPADRVPQA